MFVWPDEISLKVPRADGQRLASRGAFKLERPKNLSTCHIHVKACNLDDPASRRIAAEIIAESLDWSAVTPGRSPSDRDDLATPIDGPACPHGMVGRNACEICNDE